MIGAIALVVAATALAAGPALATATRPAWPLTTGKYHYRHGAVPLRGAVRTGAVQAATNSSDLSYQGGIGGVGVTTGPPQVYLVFWGSQWGTQSPATVNGYTYTSFSGDPNGMAPDLQAFFTGLGTNNERWSAVMTQYCQSTATVTVATGATSCPAGAAHVAYPSKGGVLAGVWEDTSSAAPSNATQAQIAQEAETAAGYFHHTTTAANRNAQYVIVSPTGTHPDGFNTPGANFCAWHDYTGDGGLGTINQANGTLAFTNLPYTTDLGSSCGKNFVNGTAGLLDGVTIIAGHEYAETLTDQFPNSGWVNFTVPGENGDLCAWIYTGQGALSDLSLATGSFAVQSTWANDFNSGAGGCTMTDSIYASNTVTVTAPAPQTSTVGIAVTPVAVSASDSDATQTLTYAASGLPAGLSINPSNGSITGTPQSAVLNAPVTVTATDGTGATGSASFTWTVSDAVPNTITVANPGSQTNAAGRAITRLTISATDNQANQVLIYSATGLPAGLSIDPSSGQITGTPQSAVLNTPVTVTATDGTAATGSASFTWTISPATMSVTNPGTQTSPPNTTISLQITAADGTTNPRTYSASGLPSGLSISSSTGVISGKTGSTQGTYNVVVTVTDTTAGSSGTAGFSWQIVGNTITIAPIGTQAWTHGKAVSVKVAASDSQSGATLTYSASGLPSGVSINSSTGLISGTPRYRQSSRTATITVKDPSGASATSRFTWSVA